MGHSGMGHAAHEEHDFRGVHAGGRGAEVGAAIEGVEVVIVQRRREAVAGVELGQLPGELRVLRARQARVEHKGARPARVGRGRHRLLPIGRIEALAQRLGRHVDGLWARADQRDLLRRWAPAHGAEQVSLGFLGQEEVDGHSLASGGETHSTPLCLLQARVVAR